MTDTQSHPETLARQHWAYVESVLKAHQVHNTVVEVCGHHYRTAFVHGYKHAIEDLERPTELCEMDDGADDYATGLDGPSLQPVIDWIERGCDPAHAAQELRMYQAEAGK